MDVINSLHVYRLMTQRTVEGETTSPPSSHRSVRDQNNQNVFLARLLLAAGHSKSLIPTIRQHVKTTGTS
jgi:hypothetical protein